MRSAARTRFTTARTNELAPDAKKHQAVVPDLISPDGLTTAELEYNEVDDATVIHLHDVKDYHRAICYKPIKDSPEPPPPPSSSAKFDTE